MPTARAILLLALLILGGVFIISNSLQPMLDGRTVRGHGASLVSTLPAGAHASLLWSCSQAPFILVQADSESGEHFSWRIVCTGRFTQLSLDTSATTYLAVTTPTGNWTLFLFE